MLTISTRFLNDILLNQSFQSKGILTMPSFLHFNFNSISGPGKLRPLGMLWLLRCLHRLMCLNVTSLPGAAVWGDCETWLSEVGHGGQTCGCYSSGFCFWSPSLLIPASATAESVFHAFSTIMGFYPWKPSTKIKLPSLEFLLPGILLQQHEKELIEVIFLKVLTVWSSGNP